MADGSPYRVIWSNQVRTTIIALANKARDLGLGDDFVRILKFFQDHLQTDPLSLGEIYRSRGVIREHHAVEDFLSIHFSIDTQRMLVYVRICRALSRLDP